MKQVITSFPQILPPGPLDPTPQPPPSLDRIIDNPSRLPDLPLQNITSILSPLPGIITPHIGIHEGAEFGRFHEFRVGVSSRCDETEDRLGQGKGEELGEGSSGDCGEDEVAARLSE